MIKETWKDIPEFKGYYKVSNLNRVKRLARYGITEQLISVRVKGHSLVARLVRDGKIFERRLESLLNPKKTIKSLRFGQGNFAYS